MSRGGGRRVGPVELPVGVGGADDPVPAPRDDEEHRGGGAQDQPGLAGDRRAGHHQVHALGGAHPQAGPDADVAEHPRHVVAPHAGRGDDGAGAHLELGVRRAGRASRSRTRTPVTSRACADQADGAGAGHHGRAQAGRGAGQGDHQPGVVDLAVVVADRAGDRVRAQAAGRAGGRRRGSGAGAAACPDRRRTPRRTRRTRPPRRRSRSGARRGRAAPPGRRRRAAAPGSAPAGPGAARAGWRAGHARCSASCTRPNSSCSR